MSQWGKPGWRFAMGSPVPVRSDYTSRELRALAKRSRDAAQARRLLSLAAVVDGASRAEAARIGGMDRQTLRDWVHRFDEEGPDGLINHPAPGATPKLNKKQKASLAALVEQGPIPAFRSVSPQRCLRRPSIYRSARDAKERSGAPSAGPPLRMSASAPARRRTAGAGGGVAAGADFASAATRDAMMARRA